MNTKVTATTPEGEKLGEWTTDSEGNHTPVDPFADEGSFPPHPVVNKKGEHLTVIGKKKGTREQMTQVMKQNEKPLEVANATPEVVAWDGDTLTLDAPVAGSLETYSRVGDLAPGPGFFKPEEIDGIDIVLLSGTKQEGDFGPYLTLEFQFKDENDNPDPDRGYPPFVVNMGGTIAVPKIAQAMLKIKYGKATGPLVCAFTKRTTANGQSFWDVQ